MLMKYVEEKNPIAKDINDCEIIMLPDYILKKKICNFILMKLRIGQFPPCPQLPNSPNPLRCITVGFGSGDSIKYYIYILYVLME